MRPEKSIREYLLALKKALVSPCTCATDGDPVKHAQCVVVGRFMAAEIATLEWVLGDNDEIGNRVEWMVAATRGG